MQAHFLARLPEDIRMMVADTESAIGFPVDIVVTPESAKGIPGEPDSLACQIELSAARILLPDAEQFRPGSVLHELLHIQRFLVEGVPRLTDCEHYEPWTPQITTALTLHDNSIEHLSIVPRELDRFPDRLEYWEGVMSRTWRSLDGATLTELDRRQGAIANWTFLKLVMPASPSVGTAGEVLAKTGAMEVAERLCEELSLALSDKKRTVRVWFRHMGVPEEMASPEYFAPREHRRWEVPLAPAT